MALSLKPVTTLWMFLMIITLMGQPAAATGTLNEFKLQAVNLDSLSRHNRNCTTLLDNSIAVTYCEDGYMALDEVGDWVNPYSTSENRANVTLDNRDALKDIRLGKFLTMVDPRGEKLTIIRKTDLKTHGIYLDTSVGGEPPVLLGG